MLAQPQLFGCSHDGALTFCSAKFMNNIFNALSILGLVGIRMVNGVKVTGGNLGSNEISINLKEVTTST
jgi:hypothetical protein